MIVANSLLAAGAGLIAIDASRPICTAWRPLGCALIGAALALAATPARRLHHSRRHRIFPCRRCADAACWHLQHHQRDLRLVVRRAGPPSKLARDRRLHSARPQRERVAECAVLMMTVPRLSRNAAWQDHIVLRLLRRRAACRAALEPELPSLVALAREMGATPHAAVALASLFRLTEAVLKRPLVAECCCSRWISADELMLLALVRGGPATGTPTTAVAITTSLRDALDVACVSARLALTDAPSALRQQRPVALARVAAFEAMTMPHPAALARFASRLPAIVRQSA